MATRLAFVHLEHEGAAPLTVRVDQIAAVGPSKAHGADGVRVTLLSGAVLTGRRPLADVRAAMRLAAAWLDEDDDR